MGNENQLLINYLISLTSERFYWIRLILKDITILYCFMALYIFILAV